MLSPCTKCLFTQILKSLLPLAAQEPQELHCRQQQPGSAWFLAQIDGVPWRSGAPQACTDGSGSHHGRGNAGGGLGPSSCVEGYSTGWATELGVLHVRGQHITGHLSFTWHKKTHTGLLLPLCPSCTLR